MKNQIDKIQHPVALSTRLMPIIFFEIWLTFSLLGFLWGPWDYSNDNYLQITLYALAGQMLLFLGYLSAIRSVPHVFFNRYCRSLFSTNPNWIVGICAIISIIFYAKNIYNLGYSPDQYFSNIINPGKAYNMFRQVPKVTGLEWRILALMDFVKIAVLPIGCTFWGQLSRKVKIIFLLNIIIQLSYFMAIGTNKIIFETIVVISVFFWIGLYENKKMNLGDMFRYSLFVFVLFLSFTAYFSYGIYQRIGGWKLHEQKVVLVGVTTQSTNSHILKTFKNDESKEKYMKLLQPPQESKEIKNTSQIKETPPNFVISIRKDHFIMEKTPKWFSQSMLSILRYSSMGYSALGFSLKCPWQWTYGFGHSLTLLIIAEKRLTFLHPLERSFPGQIEKRNNYPLMLYWHTIYPWLASDFSFTGALIIMFLLGRYSCMTWIDSIRHSNMISPVLCFLFFIACFFIPCNNQVMQSINYEFMLILLFFIWFFFSRKNQMVTE
jgi:hypothetical protein